jgi:hypothetical protein
MSLHEETPAIISRADAKAQGLPHYFTGKLCKRGHIAKRQLNGTCVLCAPEYVSASARRAQERDPEGERARVRCAVAKHYEHNRDAILAKKKTYYGLNAESIKAKEKARRAAKKAAKAVATVNTTENP